MAFNTTLSHSVCMQIRTMMAGKLVQNAEAFDNNNVDLHDALPPEDVKDPPTGYDLERLRNRGL